MRNYILPIITVIVALTTGVFFLQIPQIVYYGYFALLTFYILIRSKSIGVNPYMMAFVAIAMLSIIVNDISPKFVPWQRFLIFLSVILSISSLLISDFATKFRIDLYKVYLRILAIIMIISFIGYLTHLDLFYRNGLFQGLMKHSMILGPCAGIASIYLIVKFLSTKEKLYAIAAVISILDCLLSGSRGAIVSFICATVYLLIIYCKNNVRLFFKILICIVLFLITTSPVLLPYTESVRQKQENNLKAGGTFASRDALFTDRIVESKASPFIGSGFASVNERIAHKTPINPNTGTVEPGSSWLFILSSMGVIAFAIFIFLVIKPVIHLYRISDSNSYQFMLIGSTLVLFGVHMIIEGYILSAGSYLFWGAWLCIGIAQNDALNYIGNEKYSIL